MGRKRLSILKDNFVHVTNIRKSINNLGMWIIMKNKNVIFLKWIYDN